MTTPTNNLSKPPENRNNPPQMLQQSLSISNLPIPPPQILEAYNKIIPNAAERIIIMAEENSKHIMDLERKELEVKINIAHKSIEITKRGQNYAFLFVIFLLITVIVTAWMKAYWVAGILGSISVVGVVIAFISSGNFKQEENEKQEKQSNSIKNN